jgi:hypothetical protein
MAFANSSQEPELQKLSRLNSKFNQDVAAYSAIIHDDFICMESDGATI